jgi:molybdate transport system substrate-binding protein
MLSNKSKWSGINGSIAAIALLLAGWHTANAQEPLRIAAAADLQPVLPSVLAGFTKQTGIVAEASYKSSATLEQQIENGASFDLFMAADTSFPQKLIAAGLAEQTQPIVYARGTLVLWTRNDSPLLAKPGSRLTIDALRNPTLKTLAIANPDHAPYGRAAKAALTSLGLLDMLTPKLVTAENIAQTAQFVSTGNAELGLISLTSALTLESQGQYVVVPANAYPPILQGAITLKRSAELPEAHKLLDYLATPSVRQALAARGLASPQ